MRKENYNLSNQKSVAMSDLDLVHVDDALADSHKSGSNCLNYFLDLLCESI